MRYEGMGHCDPWNICGMGELPGDDPASNMIMRGCRSSRGMGEYMSPEGVAEYMSPEGLAFVDSGTVKLVFWALAIYGAYQAWMRLA